MTDHEAGVDEALERVIGAARAHLAAVRAAGGVLDDPAVWDSYIALNNASFRYDQLLLEEFGEVTPWETEQIDAARAGRVMPGGDGEEPTDPYPAVISVRHRRDFRVPSVSTLLDTAGRAAARLSLSGEPVPPASVGEAVLELIRDGDGSLGGLDIPELQPLGGVLTVSELGEPRRLGDPGVAAAALLAPGSGEQLVGRLDEQPFPAGQDEEDEDTPG